MGPQRSFARVLLQKIFELYLVHLVEVSVVIKLPCVSRSNHNAWPSLPRCHPLEPAAGCRCILCEMRPHGTIQLASSASQSPETMRYWYVCFQFCQLAIWERGSKGKRCCPKPALTCSGEASSSKRTSSPTCKWQCTRHRNCVPLYWTPAAGRLWPTWSPILEKMGSQYTPGGCRHSPRIRSLSTPLVLGALVVCIMHM